MKKLESKNDEQLRWLGLVAAAITSIIWGLQAIVLKLTIQTIPMMTVVWFRFAFALIVLTFYLVLTKPELLKILKSPPLGTILAGVFLAINYYTFLLGLNLTTPSNAQVMMQAAPYGLAIFSLFYFREKISGWGVLGMILTPIGLYLFFRDQFLISQESKSVLIGNLWVLFSALAWILYSILQKVLSRTLHPSQILLVVFLVTTIAIFPITDVKTIGSWNFREWFLMITLGLFTLIAYGGLAYALVRAPASQVSIIITCNPLLTIFAMQLGSAVGVLGLTAETIKPLGYIAALIVVLGVILTVTRGKN